MDNETIFWYNILYMIGDIFIDKKYEDTEIKRLFYGYWVLSMIDQN